MTVFWRAIAAGSDSAPRAALSAARAFAPALCGLGAAAMLGATLLSPVAPAGADPVSSLQQQAAALSQQMLLEQLQIDGYQTQRAADMADVAADDAQVQQLASQLDATRKRISADLSQLRVAAVKEYVEGGTDADGTSSLFSVSPSAGATAVYAEVMSGDLNSAVAKLQSDRRTLRGEEAAEEQVATDAQHSLEGANAALASALSKEQALAQQRDGVTGALAIAIAQVQAQQSAAAGAAEGSGAAAPPSSTGALPQLNAFLRCVVQAESGGDYQAISPTGQYMGAFQFSQPTWNEAAQLAGLPTLVGVPPYRASPRDQDLLAIALYNADGEQPWYDPCRD